jgi:hypothetical protein
VTFRRVTGVVRHLWISFPLVGVVVLFAVLGYMLYQGHSARVYAATAAKFGSDNKKLIEQVQKQDAATIKAKDDAIADKDRQLAAKDTALEGQTSIIGQIYNAAIALQQQVTALGGKPKTIPVTLPGRSTTLIPSPGRTVLTPTSPVLPPVAPSPGMSPAVNLQIQCPVICPPTH